MPKRTNERATLRTDLKFTDAAEGFVNPWLLDDDERREMIAKAKAGELLSVPFEAIAYWDKPNANSWRFDPATLEGVVERANADAATTTPPQLLLEHYRSTSARVGHVTGARMVEDGGTRGVAVAFEITDPGAQEDFLRRKLDRFSPGGGIPTASRCSVCEEPSEYWRWPDCGHDLGVEYDGVLAESFIEGALEETSFTGDPAIAGTAILAAERQTKEATVADKTEAAATDAAELATLRAENTEQAEKIAALEAANARANTAVFESLFGAAVGTKVSAAEREDMRILFDAKGREGFQASLDARQGITGQAQGMLGSAGGAPPPRAEDVPEDKYSRALRMTAHAKRYGILKGTTSRESLDDLGFASLRFDTSNRVSN